MRYLWIAVALLLACAVVVLMAVLARPELITEQSAVEIARRACEGKVDVPGSTPIEVKLEDGHYVVTFVVPPVPGVFMPDYYAEVTVDARTAEVIQILGG